MKYKIRYMPEARNDLEEIRLYLSQYYESTVKNFFRLLKKKIKLLKDNPFICATYDDDPDFRVLLVGNYLVFYIVNEDDHIIEIHRMFHSSRDVRRHLAGQS